jgi:hypothetical protein
VVQSGCAKALAVVRTINPVEAGEVGGKQGVAASNSRCGLGIVLSDRHDAKIPPRWLKSS